MAEDITIELPPPIQVNLNPYAFFLWGGDFLAVAKASDPPARPNALVAYFLYCQSIELSLKAFLLAKGKTKKELRVRKMGHQLDHLLAEARALGLETLVTVTPEDEEVLRVATLWYGLADDPADRDRPSKLFQYPDVKKIVGGGLKSLPSLEVLKSFASRLQNEQLEKLCLEA